MVMGPNAPRDGAAGLDVRFFQPHVTLARCAEAAAPAVGAWLRRHRGFQAAPFRVDAFELWASRLSPSGAVHTLKRRYPLGCGA